MTSITERSLRDTIDSAMAFALSFERICDALAIHKKNSTDSELRSMLHRYESVGRDAVRCIRESQANLSDRVRSMIWPDGSKPLELLRKVL